MSTLPPAKPSIGRHRILGRSETRLHFLASRPRSSPCLKAKVKKLGRRITVGENKAYDTADHLSNLRAINVTPHVAQNDSITLTGKRRRSAIDGRTTRHQGYGMSQSCRAMTECIFGWGKRSDRPLPRTLEPRVSLEAGLVAHCSACLMSMMAAWCAAVGAPSCATDFIAARTASMCELIMSVVLRAAST